MIQLNYRDSKPIHEQIEDGIRKLILHRTILPGEKLLSVQEFASKLAINPNTIEKAYDTLEKEGYVYREEDNILVARQDGFENARIEELWIKLRDIVEEIQFFSVSKEEIIRHIQEDKAK